MIDKFLRSFYYPEATPSSTEFERELIYERSKSSIYTQMAFIICLFLYLPYTLENEVPSVLLWAIFGLVALPCHLLSARRYLKEFEMCYNLSLLILNPLTVWLIEESIFGSWMICFGCPVYIFCLTGNLLHFFTQSFGQIVCALFLLKSPTVFMIEKHGTSEFVNHLIAISLMSQLLFLAGMVQLNTLKNFSNDKAKQSQTNPTNLDYPEAVFYAFSNELRNMVNVVVGSIENSLLEELPGTIRDTLMRGKLFGNILVEEIKNTLDLDKIDMIPLTFTIKEQSSKELFNKVWLVTSELMKRRDVRGLFAVSKNFPVNLLIDEGRFTQIWLNLLRNALKNTEEGSIHVLIDWLPPDTPYEDCYLPIPFQEDSEFENKLSLITFNVDYSCYGLGIQIPNNAFTGESNVPGILRLIVKDSGPGMTEEDCGKTFQRMTPPTGVRPDREALGTGLGLYLSRHICRKLGGDMRAFSKPGKGMAIVMVIPIDFSSHPGITGKEESFALMHKNGANALKPKKLPK